MSNLDRRDYQHLIELARELHDTCAAARRREIAEELFDMVEGVIGQQLPPLKVRYN